MVILTVSVIYTTLLLVVYIHSSRFTCELMRSSQCAQMC